MGQPVSTYVSATAKGVHIEDYMVISSKTKELSEELEPICPDPLEETIIPLLKQLDELPAYKFRHHLLFYHAEKALKDVFCLNNSNIYF